MKNYRLWMILLVIVCSVGCQRKTSGEWIDSCPHATVYLQPNQAGRFFMIISKSTARAKACDADCSDKCMTVIKR